MVLFIIYSKHNRIKLKKKNYLLEQFNSLLPLGIRVQNVDNFIRIIRNDYYSFDKNLNLCLGFVENRHIIYLHTGLKFKFYIKK